MLYFGNRNEELLEKNINDLSCSHCESVSNQKLIIYCRALTVGIFYPLKWWSFDKKGFLECTKCGNKSLFDSENIKNQPSKIIRYFDETKLPIKHRIPSYFLFGSIFLTAFLMIFILGKTMFILVQSPENALSGQWNEEYGRYTMYVYDDKTYTLLNRDTIIYGNYDVDGVHVTFDFLGRASTFHKFNTNPIRLYDRENVDFEFERIRNNPFDDLYTQKQNRWRIKPYQPQNNDQIRQKILNYINFEITKYEIVKEKDLKYIDIDPNSPLTFALNGIATSREYQNRWRSIFHNEDDWLKANKILEEEFPSDFKISSYKYHHYLRNLDFLKALKYNIEHSTLAYLLTS